MNDTHTTQRGPGAAHGIQPARGARAKRGRRRQRAVMATDSEWQAVRERAEAAGMDVSRFIVERLTAPADEPGEREWFAFWKLARSVARTERLVRVLWEVEKQRMENHGEAGDWDILVGRATRRVELEERLP